ncbi:MAG: 1,4-dihydroxy-2-naphthoate octaprenyltransferase [Candidatus Brocadiia bacterium]
MNEVPIPTPSGLEADDPLVRKLLVAARLPFLTASVLPAVAATAAVWRLEGSLRAGRAALAIVGVGLLHAGANLANDFFDHLSGDDAGNRAVTPFSGGSRVIQEGVLSARAVLAASLACLAAGTACGLALWRATGGHGVLLLGLAGLAIGWAYTAPPLQLSHRGLGELGVFAAFGPLPAMGVEYVQRGAFSLEGSWVGVPAGLLVAAILVVNEFPDVEADAAAGKRHLVARLGRRRAVALYELLVAGAYAAVAAGVLAGWMPPAALAVALVAPLSCRAIGVLRAHYADVRAMLPAQAATIAQQAVFLLLLTGAYLADLGLDAW